MATNLYDNLDFCLEIYKNLSSGNYDNNENKYKIVGKDFCYKFEPIVQDEIKMSDLKKDQNFDYSHIFDAEFEFVSFFNNKWNFRRFIKINENKVKTCMVSIGKYVNGTSTVHQKLNKSQFYNMAMMYIFSEMVILDKVPHSILPIMYFDIKYKSLLGQNKTFKKELEKHKINDNDDVYVIITEDFNEMTTVEEYLNINIGKMSELDWKVLIFQVLFFLVKATERLAQFRHNNLRLDSLKLDIQQRTGKPRVYKFGDTEWEVPDVGFCVKVGDYEFVTTTEYIRNDDTIIRGKIQDNPYYDVHTFLNEIYFKIIEKNPIIPDSLRQLMNDLLPVKYLVTDPNNFEGLDESKFDMSSNTMVVPLMILKKNNFFNEFIIKKK